MGWEGNSREFPQLDEVGESAGAFRIVDAAFDFDETNSRSCGT